MHTDLRCTACQREHDAAQLHNLCAACGKPLFAGYDLAGLKSRLSWQDLRARDEPSMWRFHEVLPVSGPDQAVSLGEGRTPLLRCEPRGPFAGFAALYVKDEAKNPTGSFKARGMSAAITRAAALGVGAVALPSAGNAAGAAAHYAARAGLECHVFMPVDTPPANIVESVVVGAHVYLVRGLIGDCGKLVARGCERDGWFALSTLKEPFRVEGKKTMGYELAFDLMDAPGAGAERPTLPDVILYPAGGGTGLIGMWKAFDEMQALGWIGPERPHMVAVQAETCSPIVRAFEAGADHAEPFPAPATVASGLRVPSAIGDFLMLRAIRASGGTAVAVSDAELLAGVRELAEHQGIYACPEGGAVWSAAKKLASSGWLRRDQRVVLFNTGAGLKYNHLFDIADLPEPLPVLDPL